MFLICSVDYGLKNSGVSIFNYLYFRFLKFSNIKTKNIIKYIFNYSKDIKLFLIGYSPYYLKIKLNILININFIFSFKNFIRFLINLFYIKIKLINEFNSSKFFIKKNKHKYSSCYNLKNYCKFLKK